MPTRLDQSYTSAVRQVRARVEAFALARFGAGQFRDPDLDRFVRAVVPIVLAGQRQISSLTDAYLAMVLSERVGRTIRSQGPLSEYPREGADPLEVYARPYVAVRTALSVGKSLDQARSEGVERLRDIARTDMQLAKTHTARRIFDRTPEVRAFRRTLTGSKNCALCYVASTQRYHREDLLPIHPGCDCGVDPITDTGEQIIDRATLAQAHEAIQDRFGQAPSDARAIDYRKAILTREHGELGPVLTVAEHRFTGPNAI